MGHDKITPEGRKFFAEIQLLKQLQVRVGYQQGTKHQKKDAKSPDVDMVDVAMFNELGTSRSPSRPFLRKSVDDNVDEMNDFNYQQLALLSKGQQTAEGVMKAVGAAHQGRIIKTIDKGDFVPNAPSTIARKGSDHPLIDIGQLKQSAHYVITKKGGK